MFAVGDTAALARHTQKLLNDSHLAQHIAAAARRRATSDFSLDRMVEQFALLYEELTI